MADPVSETPIADKLSGMCRQSGRERDADYAKAVLNVATLERETAALREQVAELTTQAEEWKEKWRREKSHGCPEWGNHTSDGRERVCFYDKPEIARRTEQGLREQVAKLEKAIKDSLPELEWYAKRKKNLAETTDTGGTWADLLNLDLDVLRAALDAAKEGSRED